MTPDPTAWERFEAEARRQGFDAVLVREWSPGHETGRHAHPFDAMAVVARGDFELHWGPGHAPQRVHLRTGDAFLLGREQPHAERYGTEGATVWVARRSG